MTADSFIKIYSCKYQWLSDNPYSRVYWYLPDFLSNSFLR